MYPLYNISCVFLKQFNKIPFIHNLKYKTPIKSMVKDYEIELLTLLICCLFALKEVRRAESILSRILSRWWYSIKCRRCRRSPIIYKSLNVQSLKREKWHSNVKQFSEKKLQHIYNSSVETRSTGNHCHPQTPLLKTLEITHADFCCT